MADQDTARITQVPGARSDEADQQIPFDVREDAGWPRPTAREESGTA